MAYAKGIRSHASFPHFTFATNVLHHTPTAPAFVRSNVQKKESIRATNSPAAVGIFVVCAVQLTAMNVWQNFMSIPKKSLYNLVLMNFWQILKIHL